jgi:hypothetical protein
MENDYNSAIGQAVIQDRAGITEPQTFQEQMNYDRSNMDNYTFAQTYGHIAQQDRAGMAFGQDIAEEGQTQERSFLQNLGDSTLELGSAATSLVGGAAATIVDFTGSAFDALVPDLHDNKSTASSIYQAISGGEVPEGLSDFTRSIDPRVSGEATSTFISEATKTGQDYIKSFRTDDAQDAEKFSGQLDQAKSKHNTNRYDNEIAAGGNKTMATLKLVGRNALSAANTVLEVDGQLQRVTVESLPSLVGSAAVAKNLIKLVGSSSAIAISTGLIEGTSSMNETINKVANMPFSELTNVSAPYRSLIARGFTPEEARNRVASNTGRIAALITGLGSAAIAKVPGFSALDESILAKSANKVPLGSYTKNVIKSTAGETAEEATQSGLSAFAGNVSEVISGANPDNDLVQGVGEGIGVGALAGGTLGGGVSSVTNLGEAADDISSGVSNVSDKLETRRVKKADDASQVGTKATTSRIEDVETSLYNNPNSAFSADLADKDNFTSFAKSQEYKSTSVLGIIQEIAENIKTDDPRFGAVRGIAAIKLSVLADKAQNLGENASPEDKAMAASITKIVQNPKITSMIREQLSQDQKAPTEDISNEDLAEETIVRAGEDISKVSKEAATKVKKLHQEGDITITNDELNAVNVAYEIKASQEKYQEHIKSVWEAAKDAEPAGVPDEVLSEIQQDFDREVGDQGAQTKGKSIEETSQRLQDTGFSTRDHKGNVVQLSSVSQIATSIVKFATKGDTVNMRKQFIQLHKLHKHMKSKIAAFERAKVQFDKTGRIKPVKFLTLAPNGELLAPGEEAANSVTLYPNEPKSVALAKAAQLDAEMVTNTYNSLIDTYATYSKFKRQEVPVLTDEIFKEIPTNDSVTPTEAVVAPSPVSTGLLNDQKNDKNADNNIQATSEQSVKDVPQNGADKVNENKVEDDKDKAIHTAPIDKDAQAPNLGELTKEPGLSSVSGRNKVETPDRVAKPTDASDLGNSNSIRSAPAENEHSQEEGIAAPKNSKNKEEITGVQDIGALKSGSDSLSTINDIHDGSSNEVNKEKVSDKTAIETDQKEAQSEDVEVSNTEENLTRSETYKLSNLVAGTVGEEIFTDLYNQKETTNNEVHSVKSLFAYHIGNLKSIMQSNEKDEANRHGIRYNDQENAAYRALLKLVVPIKERLNTKINVSSLFKGADNKKISKILNNRNLTAGLFAQLGEDNKLSYSDPIAHALISALFNSLVQSSDKSGYNVKSVANEFGLQDPLLVTDAMVQATRAGSAPFILKEEISKNILRVLEIKADKLAQYKEVISVINSISSELMAVAQEIGIINNKKFHILTNDQRVEGHKNIPEYAQRVVIQGPLTTIRKSGGTHKSLFDIGYADGNSEQAVFSSKDAEDATNDSIRNSTAKATDSQLLAMKNSAKTEHKVNRTFVSALRAFGETSWLLFNGIRPDDMDLLNESHALTVEGQMQTKLNDLAAVNQVVDKADAEALNTDKDQGDISVFFGYYLNSLGRFTQSFSGGPTANKTARAAFSLEPSILDMNEAKNRSNFFSAIGQMAEEADPDKQSGSVAAKVGKKHFDDSFPNSTKLIQEALKEEEFALNDEIVKELIAEAKGKGSPDLLNAIIEYSRYKNAVEEGGEALSIFSTTAVIEIDGITNGIINALLNLTTGAFTGAFVENLRKGGISLGTTNLVRNSDLVKAKVIDFYNTIGGKLSLYSADIHTEIIQDTNAISTINAYNRLFTSLGLATFNDDGTLQFDRSVVKNPVTVKLYGAGIAAIAGKLSKGLIDTVYESLSEGLVSGDLQAIYPEIAQDLQTLMGDTLWYNHKESKHFVNPGRSSSPIFKAFTTSGEINHKGAKTFKFTQKDITALQENIAVLFGAPFEAAMQDSIGNALDNSSLIESTTLILSKLARLIFDNKIGTDLKSLTETQFEEAKSLAQTEFGPVFPIDDQNSVSANLQKTDKASIGVKTQSTDKKFTTDSAIKSIGEVVKGTPSVNIGGGDANMMREVFAKNPGIKAVNAFDALITALSSLEQVSQAANSAVAHSAFETNIFKGILEALEAIRQLPEMHDKEIAQQFSALMKEYKGGLGKKHPLKKLSNSDPLQHLSSMFKFASNSADARNYALKTIDGSWHQMASGAEPFINEGTNPTFGEPVENALNKAFYSKLREGKETAPDLNETIDDKEFGDEVHELLEAAPANYINRKDIVKLLVDAKNVKDPILRNIVTVLNSALPGNLKVSYGDSVSLSRFVNNNSDENVVSPDDFEDVKGTFISDGNLIAIKSKSVLTTIHELVHAAIGNKISAYYNGGIDLLSENQIVNIKGLELAMDKYLSLVIDENTLRGQKQEFIDQNIQVQAYIRDLYNSGSKSDALNEFVAWSMTDINIRQNLAKHKITGRLLNIVKGARRFLSKILGFSTRESNTLYDAVEFNALSLANSKQIKSDMHGTAQLHQVSMNKDTRVKDLIDTFTKTVATKVQAVHPNPEQDAKNKIAVDQRAEVREELLKTLKLNYFNIDMEGEKLFHSLLETYLAGGVIKTDVSASLEKLYAHVKDKLHADDLIPEGKLDDPIAQEIGLGKFKVLFRDKIDAFSHLNADNASKHRYALFLVMSQIDPELREALTKIKKPKIIEGTYDTIDNAIFSIGDTFMNAIAADINPRRKHTGSSIDSLVSRLADIENTFASKAENAISSSINKVDATGASIIQKIANTVYNATETKEDKAQYKKFVTGLIHNVAGLTSDSKRDQTLSGIIKLVNSGDVFHGTKDLISSIIGKTTETADVLDLVNRVKYRVSVMRQIFRNTLPAEFEKYFNNEVSKRDKKSLHKGIGELDLASLINDQNDAASVRDLISNETSLDARIDYLEKKIANLNPKDFAFFKRKAKQLAHFLNTGITGDNLIHNANAIFAQVGTDAYSEVKLLATHEALDLDKLISAYALKGLDQNHRATLTKLSKSDPDAIDKMLYFLAGLRENEKAKTREPAALRNGQKGYIPNEVNDSSSIKIANDWEEVHLTEMGYTRIGDYQGADSDTNSMGYYYSNISAKAGYAQGIMQTASASYNGVNPITGQSKSHKVGGYIDIVKLRNNGSNAYDNPTVSKSGEGLAPVWGNQGEIIGYNRMIDPSVSSRQVTSDDLAKMIGAWKGRQLEESVGKDMNEVLVDKLIKLHRSPKSGDNDQFIDVMNTDAILDPTLIDAVSNIPTETREYIKKNNKGKLFIRKDMINNTIGHRNVSVRDLFTGDTRLSKGTRQKMVRLAQNTLGTNAYKYLVNSEDAIQFVVSTAKETIVIRSVVVPVANIMSNIMQLTMLGLGIVDIARSFKGHTTELNTFIKNRTLIEKLNIDILSMKKGSPEIVRLTRKVNALIDRNNRMSIAPLIEAGEFATISEGMTDLDESIAQGKYVDMMSNLASKLPDSMVTVGKNVLITKDTALFQGLSRMVQYGDFLAKAALYEHHLKNKGSTKAEALEAISEEFVNYNFLSGRTRSYLESMGLVWFSNYKIGSVKVALRMIKNNPFRSLLFSVGGNPLDLGSPVSDNLISVGADGRLGYSLGPGMLFSAPGLNPVANLFN